MTQLFTILSEKNACNQQLKGLGFFDIPAALGKGALVTLSQLASVSREGLLSLDQKSSPRAQPVLGAVLLDNLWGNSQTRQHLESLLPPSSQKFFQSLRNENDSEIFFHDLLQLAAQLDQLGRADLAQVLDEGAANFLKEQPDTFSELRHLAQSRIQARTGRGDFGPRAEIVLNRFCREVADPAMLLAMGLAPQAFRLGKFWGLGRFGSAGFLARAFGNGVGFLAETATFTLSHRAAATALGRPQDWNPKAVANEWASSALVLGAMKVAGNITRIGLEGSLGGTSLLRLSEDKALHGWILRSLPHLGNYLGIVVGQDLQEGLGLRETQDRGAFVADALATLLQAKVGGDLVSGVLGKGFQSFSSELDFRSKNFPIIEHGTPGNRWASETAFSPNLNPAFQVHESPPVSEPMLSEAEPRSSGSSRTGDYRLIKQFLDHLSPELKEALRGVQNDMQGSLNFLRTLMKTELQEPEDRETAFFRIFHALRNSEIEGDRGSYPNWLTRRAFEDIQAKDEFARLDPMLRFLIDGGSLRSYESQLATDLSDQALLHWPAWLPEFVQRRRFSTFKRIQDLRVSSHSKQVLVNWAATEEKRTDHEAAAKKVDALLQKIEAVQEERSLYVLEIDHILKEANSSPLARLRIQRLGLLLDNPDELTLGKMAELGDPHFMLVGRKHPKPSAPLFRSIPSQFNSYLLQSAPEGTLRETLKRGPDLIASEKAPARTENRRKVLGKFLFKHGRVLGYSHADLAEAFKLLGDPLSQQLVKSLQRREFDLHVLDQDAFRKAVQSRCDDRMDGSQLAVFIPPEHSGERSMILVREVPLVSYSNEAAPDALFLMLARIIHEYQHYLDIKPGVARTQYVHFYQEMNAHLREALWRAEHGDAEKLRTYLEEGNGGPALNFRDHFEKDYGVFFPKRKEVLTRD